MTHFPSPGLGFHICKEGLTTIPGVRTEGDIQEGGGSCMTAAPKGQQVPEGFTVLQATRQGETPLRQGDGEASRRRQHWCWPQGGGHEGVLSP